MVSKKILILGVTASGKGSLAFELAKRLDGEIISVDSMKVYRRMDIGTAKPPADKRRQMPYHLIDVVEPSEAFSVDRFLELTDAAVGQIQAAGKQVVAVGGTAMYIKALLHGLFEGPASDAEIRRRLTEQIAQNGLAALHQRLLQIDPAAAERIHPNDLRRIVRALEVFELTGKPITALQKQWETDAAEDWFVIGLRRPKDIESTRINSRVKRMVDEGLLGEVKALLAEPQPLSKQARAAIGYAEVIDHLEGKCSYEEAVEQIKINTRKFAKAQRTWFKTFRNVRCWININESDTLQTVTEAAIHLWNDR
ncbi:MAG: tRNA (adenosine(37)-N6)-dimethylallyltransferase MiaA [Phycisphaerae bacterium]|nr:tRNA (adenosine(37)-N6)-dimethylallyltransferase MiaA [Phycisphaerae bacterium]